MIFLSKGQGAASPFVFRASWRAAPIMGIDRSTLSRRSILLLFVLLGAPVAARCDALEDSAREMARKIAAAMPEQREVYVEIRNLSSLAPDTVAKIQQTLDAELKGRGVRIAPGSGSAAGAEVTLSENIEGYVWSAEIRQDGALKTVFRTMPKFYSANTGPRAKLLILHAEKFWEGPEPVLDAAIVGTVDLEKRIVLLVPDGMMVRGFSDDSSVKIPIDSKQTATRSPDGAILGIYPLTVLLEPNVCTILLVPPGLQECHPASKVRAIPGIPGHGQVTEIHSSCGSGIQTLASGSGDDTEPDSVQAFEELSGSYVPVSEEFSFPGPVRLHREASFPNPTAIVKNLQTGRYEAYSLSISCAM